MSDRLVIASGMEDMAVWYRQILALTPPEEALFLEAVLTPKWVIVLGSRERCGFAFRFAGEHAVYGTLDYEPLFQEIRPYLNRPLTSLVEYLLTLDGLCVRGICLAALNALSAPFNRADALAERSWDELPPASLPFLRPEDRVVCVGYGALVREIISVCGQVHISDMRPRSSLEIRFLSGKIPVGPDGVVFHDPKENPQLLAGADVVLLTGCTFVNGTWQTLVHCAEHARVIGLFGPSAGLPPELLRSMGFHYVTTSRVQSPQLMIDRLRIPQSEGFGRTQGYSLMLQESPAEQAEK